MTLSQPGPGKSKPRQSQPRFLRKGLASQSFRARNLSIVGRNCAQRAGSEPACPQQALSYRSPRQFRAHNSNTWLDTRGATTSPRWAVTRSPDNARQKWSKYGRKRLGTPQFENLKVGFQLDSSAFVKVFWWRALRDLNPRPTDPSSAALIR